MRKARAGNVTERPGISARLMGGMLASWAKAGGCARAVAELATQAIDTLSHRTASMGNFALPRQRRMHLRTSDINFLRTTAHVRSTTSAERDSRQFLRYLLEKL
jgi:hypothetical protein